MKQITQQKANGLTNTHFHFYEAHIQAQTDKAIQVKIYGHPLAQYSKFWVPKSRIKILLQTDTRRALNDGTGNMVRNPEYGKERIKYLFPLYFLAPHRFPGKSFR